MEWFLIGMWSFMSLFMFWSSKSPSTKGTNVFLLCSHSGLKDDCGYWVEDGQTIFMEDKKGWDTIDKEWILDVQNCRQPLT